MRWLIATMLTLLAAYPAAAFCSPPRKIIIDEDIKSHLEYSTCMLTDQRSYIFGLEEKLNYQARLIEQLTSDISDMKSAIADIKKEVREVRMEQVDQSLKSMGVNSHR